MGNCPRRLGQSFHSGGNTVDSVPECPGVPNSGLTKTIVLLTMPPLTALSTSTPCFSFPIPSTRRANMSTVRLMKRRSNSLTTTTTSFSFSIPSSIFLFKYSNCAFCRLHLSCESKQSSVTSPSFTHLQKTRTPSSSISVKLLRTNATHAITATTAATFCRNQFRTCRTVSPALRIPRNAARNLNPNGVIGATFSFICRCSPHS